MAGETKRHDGKCDVRGCKARAAQVRTFTVTGSAIRLYRVCEAHAQAVDAGGRPAVIFRQRRGVIVTADGHTGIVPTVRR